MDAKLALVNNRPKNERARKIQSLWFLIQEHLGPAKSWPNNIRFLFWKKFLKHWDRYILATFIYINSIPKEIFFEWLDIMPICRDASARYQFHYLINIAYPNGKYKKAFSWNTTAKIYTYVTGEPSAKKQ